MHNSVLLTSKMKVEANSAAASLIKGGQRKRTAMAKSLRQTVKWNKKKTQLNLGYITASSILTEK